MLKEATEDMPQGVTMRFRNGSIFKLSRLKASTKVTETLIRELLFADDCMMIMMSYHTQPDLQHMTTKFSNAAKSYGLQISITKTVVVVVSTPTCRDKPTSSAAQTYALPNSQGELTAFSGWSFWVLTP